MSLYELYAIISQISQLISSVSLQLFSQCPLLLLLLLFKEK